MLAAAAVRINADDPLSGLEIGDRPAPQAPEGWTTVTVKASALNHHDLWSLRGVGLGEDRLPMILGCDAAGVDEEGREVIVHAVISQDSWRGDETLDPKRSLLSEVHPGTLAERVAVPRRNLVPQPAELGRIFFLQLRVIGSTMGTREELERLVALCVQKGVRPRIDRTLPLGEARQGFQAMLEGSFVGKIVFTV